MLMSSSAAQATKTQTDNRRYKCGFSAVCRRRFKARTTQTVRAKNERQIGTASLPCSGVPNRQTDTPSSSQIPASIERQKKTEKIQNAICWGLFMRTPLDVLFIRYTYHTGKRVRRQENISAKSSKIYKGFFEFFLTSC